ncbi:MAG: hypothetical protein JGK30_14715 [Microcoleus sp. PH2017_40_RAT_O_B]|uniref:hypothetical protein n=1 Tax=unclassified Microcoleus TaxID=2642155 RepID=UPI001D20CBDC|nr:MULTISPECIES: hypothetical protein [unclassified Microcoleus]MCC3573342.1 hypothetical protein [Microcoleus sp. PH2017_34_RAT_O_A]MCC3610724.1 hypothetical protein [Microcoleus sp. PH2017_40_RAT_O_B]
MPPIRRLTDLEKTLELRYETLGEAEKDLAMTTNTFEITSIKQRIRERVLPDIRKCEAEYWQLLAQEARTCDVAEAEASDAIIEVVQEAELIQSQPDKYPAELMQKLQAILDKLNEPGQLAAGKAKLVLSLIPGLVSYELEMDTESSLRRVFQPIKRMYKKAFDEGK